MTKLINTIVKDAKEGSYVSQSEHNPYNIKGAYAPRDYQRAVKEVWYCYDDGSVRKAGIGEAGYEDTIHFHEDQDILDLYEHVNFYNEVQAFNGWLATLDIETTLDAIAKDEWTIRYQDLAPLFKGLVKYLKNLDITQPPQPYGDLGFYYIAENYDDGTTRFFVVAIVKKEDHKQVEFHG